MQAASAEYILISWSKGVTFAPQIPSCAPKVPNQPLGAPCGGSGQGCLFHLLLPTKYASCPRLASVVCCQAAASSRPISRGLNCSQLLRHVLESSQLSARLTQTLSDVARLGACLRGWHPGLARSLEGCLQFQCTLRAEAFCQAFLDHDDQLCIDVFQTLQAALSSSSPVTSSRR